MYIVRVYVDNIGTQTGFVFAIHGMIGLESARGVEIPFDSLRLTWTS